MNAILSDEISRLADQLFRRGFNEEEVSLELRQKGVTENRLSDIIRAVKNLRQLKRRRIGFFCCGTGVFLLVVGCMLTLLLYSSGQNIRLVMYGLTTIGVGFTIKGMVDLLGW